MENGKLFHVTYWGVNGSIEIDGEVVVLVPYFGSEMRQ